MNFVLNYVFAWLAVLLGLVLCGKFILRKLAMKKNATTTVRTINKQMRKPHIWLGVGMAVVGLVHGIYSSQPVLSVNLGTIAWVIGLLCGVNYALRKRFKQGRTWLVYHRALAVLLIGLTCIHVIDVGGIQIFKVFSLQQEMRRLQREDLAPDMPSSAGSSSLDGASSGAVSSDTDGASSGEPSSGSDREVPSENNSDVLSEYNQNLFGVVLADGTYTGTATGYRPGLTVEVTVKDNQVRSIEVISHNEQGEQFYGPPMARIPDAIISEQSLDVDAVSGATYTSIGLLNAVNDALSNAVVSGELPAMKSFPSRNGPRH